MRNRLLLPLLVSTLMTLIAYQLLSAETSPYKPIDLNHYHFDPINDGQPTLPNTLKTAALAPYALLQLHDDADTQGLRTLGVQFVHYIPHDAYVIALPANKVAAVKRHPAVRWLGPLQSAYKLAAGVEQASQVAIVPFDDAERAHLAAELRLAGVTDLEENAVYFKGKVSAETLPAIAALPSVYWIQPLATVQELNDDAGWLAQSGLRERRTLNLRGLSGDGQVGAVADSGLAVYDFVGANNTSCFFVDDSGGTAALPSATHRKVVSYTIPPGAGR